MEKCRYIKDKNGVTKQVCDPDVQEWAKQSTKPSYTKSEVGLGNVTNDAQVKRTEMGANNGVATLGEDGKVPSAQLPAKQDPISDLSTIRNGASAGATAYQKPSGGIPSTDLTTAVQNLLTAAGTALQPADLNTLNGKVSALEAYFSSSADSDNIINKWNEVVSFLAGITESQTLDGIISGINDAIAAKYTKPSTGIPASDLAEAVQTSLGKADTALQTHQDISGKQDVISDLETIRSGAALGATALQSHQDISGKADKNDTYTKTEVDAKIADVDRKYDVTVAGHTMVFAGRVGVTNHKVVFL